MPGAGDPAKYGKDDKTIRPGDMLHCDVGIKYMRWNSDHQEVAYVLKVGEPEAPEGLRKLLSEANRLQDVYCAEFKTGLTGNELLSRILGKAREIGFWAHASTATRWGSSSTSQGRSLACHGNRSTTPVGAMSSWSRGVSSWSS